MQPPRPQPFPALAGLMVSLGLLLAPLTSPAARAAEATAAQLQALQAALNGQGDLANLLESGPGLDPQREVLQRRALLNTFPDARWSLSAGKPLKDGRATVQLRLVGSHQEGPTRYRLEASQLLVLSSNGSRINGQTVLQEQSVLRSGATDLPVSLMIPNSVLTGQRYDVDLVLDEPLEDALVAGGISAVAGQQRSSLATPSVELGALGGGGLFKTVQAPFSPGSQTWALLLVHPKGVVSATKLVRVVADKSQLNP